MSTLFQTRPVFPLTLNVVPDETRFIYDDNQTAAGFGAPVLTPAQAHARRRVQLVVGALDAGDVATVEAWLAELSCGLRSVWFPCELQEADVLSVGDDGPKTFRVLEQGLADAFPLAAGLVLRLCSPANVATPVTVTDVTVDGDEEIVTVAEDLPAGFSAAWHVSRLLLARVLDLGWTHLTEGRSNLTVSAIELPLDYATPEDTDAAAATTEAWLYLITRYLSDRDIVGWRLTSAPRDLTHDGKTWAAAQIDHDSLSTGTEGDTDALKLRLGDWADNPFHAWFPRHLAGSYGVTLAKVKINPATGESIGDAVIWFKGMVVEPLREGSLFTVSCKSGLALDGRVVPSFLFATTCGYDLFQQDTCAVWRPDFELAGDLDDVNLDAVTVDFSCADLASKALDWLRGGAITITAGGETETRYIREVSFVSSTVHRLTLNAPTVLAAVADTAVAVPGCDKLLATCGDKFDNVHNFGGHPFISNENLSVTAMPQAGTPSGMGKK